MFQLLFQAFLGQNFIFIDRSLHNSFFTVNFLKLQLLTEHIWAGFSLNMNLGMFMCFETVSLKYLEIYLHLYYWFKGISIQAAVTSATMKVIKVQMEFTRKFKDVMWCRFWTRTYISQLRKIRISDAVKPSFIG